ncbi:MAG: hypothetical protein AB1489_17685 [Acidobacteriota bacterium]
MTKKIIHAIKARHESSGLINIINNEASADVARAIMLLIKTGNLFITYPLSS